MNLAGLYIYNEAKKRRIKKITVEIVPKRAGNVWRGHSCPRNVGIGRLKTYPF